MMKCNGNCYCGNACVIDHETIAKCCICSSNGYNHHLSCTKLCEVCKKYRCIYIANHTTKYSGCKCLSCNYHQDCKASCDNNKCCKV